jgi:carbon-monoxide dehydrogenase small subunit
LDSTQHTGCNEARATVACAAWNRKKTPAPAASADPDARVKGHPWYMVYSGCGNGNCGTCTVIVDGAAVNACLVLAQEAPGRDILTIEGLSRHGTPHPIQQALVEHGGTQCGFCTPGIVLGSLEALRLGLAGDRPAIRRSLAGNLCRCTGYTKIIEAIAIAAAAAPILVSGQWLVAVYAAGAAGLAWLGVAISYVASGKARSEDDDKI